MNLSPELSATGTMPRNPLRTRLRPRSQIHRSKRGPKLPAHVEQVFIMKKLVAVLPALLLTLTPAMSFAHHSFALFDTSKEVTLNGVVKEYQWTNPHMFVQVIVTGPDGNPIEWSIEGASLNTLTRIGWNRNTVKPGEKVVAIIHPMRDGSKGGSMV